MGFGTVVASRYEFLLQLHTALKPRGYIEIGVQTGGSLILSQCDSIGIDPYPTIIEQLSAHHRIRQVTSDLFFSDQLVDNDLPRHVDFAFIDGMHLAEYALRDFMHVEAVGHSGTVIAIDDVLPYNEAIATREQPPGDWTGDVWKLIDVLRDYRPDLTLTLVNTFPTGTLVVTDVNPTDRSLHALYDDLEAGLVHDVPPPHWVVARETAVSPEAALEIIMRGRS
jgi:predicted O-methyltransferase YrrM